MTDTQIDQAYRDRIELIRKANVKVPNWPIDSDDKDRHRDIEHEIEEKYGDNVKFSR